MPKNKAEDQALYWLYSKSCDTENVFDAMNAANAINIIHQRNKQLKSLRAHFCNLKKQRDRFQAELSAEIAKQEKSSEIATGLFEEYFGHVPCRLCEKLGLVKDPPTCISFLGCPSWKEVWSGLLKGGSHAKLG